MTNNKQNHKFFFTVCMVVIITAVFAFLPTDVYADSEEIWYAVLEDSNGKIISSLPPASNSEGVFAFGEKEIVAEYQINSSANVVVMRYIVHSSRLFGNSDPSGDYLSDYLKIGQSNDSFEVMKLQYFLRSFGGFERLHITGFFDQSTFDAVSEFQMRHKEDVLVPWGYDAPTGYVYITTQNKINEICRGKEKNKLALSSPIELEEEETDPVVTDVELADLQLLAELGARDEFEKKEKSKKEAFLAALNFVANNRLVAVLVALGIFFMFSLFMVWKKSTVGKVR